VGRPIRRHRLSLIALTILTFLQAADVIRGTSSAPALNAAPDRMRVSTEAFNAVNLERFVEQRRAFLLK
jgi:hypothetical protein